MNPVQLAQIGLLGLISYGISAGCALPRRHLAATRTAAIQARTTEVFAGAHLYKPPESGLDQPLPVQLAPLLITDAAPSTAPIKLKLTVRSRITLLHDRWHRQFTYLWHTGPTRRGRDSVQGVRITLNSTDAPAIWEILQDASGAEIIYVAQSLELAAATKFGPPLPGRKFSIEAARTATPALVVANVISDGPVTMGPILYLRAKSADVTALICRCMPSQFTALVDTQDYELAEAPTPPSPPNEGFSPIPLDQRLRLPSNF